MSATFTRGTKTSKSTTKALQPGTVVLTEGRPDGRVGVAARKTGAVLRVVQDTRKAAPEAYERQARTIVDFTDGTFSTRYSSSQTWMVAALAPADVEEPVIVKAGEAAPLAEQDAPRQDTPASEAIGTAAQPAGQCACCGQPTKGGHYLPGHDAKHAACLVAEIRHGREIASALAEIPAKHAKLEAKVMGRLAKLALIK